jgi:hypothetical protein
MKQAQRVRNRSQSPGQKKAHISNSQDNSHHHHLYFYFHGVADKEFCYTWCHSESKMLP